MATPPAWAQGVEDSVMSVWSMPSGAMVLAHESFTHAFAGTGIEVHGTEGSIFARGVMTQRPVGEVELVTAQPAARKCLSVRTDLYEQAVRRFCEAVAGKGRPAADGADGVKSLAVADGGQGGRRTGQRTAVRYYSS